jgi:4-diphosphocytidyl-2-C-methyl-D-erythritol kinase
MPPARPIGELARAKINLTLSVRGRRADGYHALESLVTFAVLSDIVTIEVHADDRLTVSGTFAREIGGENLLTRTMALLRDAEPRLRIGSVHLQKEVPVAAGLGGGSADAAALLRLVRRANRELAGDVRWLEIAARLGADVPVCFADRPALMWGIGEQMALLPSFPALHAVLINPRVALATASVFAALRAGPASTEAPAPTVPALPDRSDVLGYMRARGNDLEPAAIELLPQIAEIEALLAAQPDCQLAAMSGSGPTCFGIFPTGDSARRAAASIAQDKPEWWVEATRFGGAP